MLEQKPFDINAIESYVHSLQSAQTSRILLVNTHHSALDALLNQKALVARNRSIDVQFRVNDLSAVKIDLVDLTVIISNTLDNAIEACEKLPVQDRQIYIQVVLDDNELFYAVRNRSLPVDVSSDRLPVTTKENPSFHGYGLQNVQTTLASLLHKGMRTIIQSSLRMEASEPCNVYWTYQPHRPEKPLPQPQNKK